MPCVVDGPMPIRMIAPPKKEKVVHCDWLPIIWKQHEEDTINGRTMCAHLEATLDCMTNRAIRSMASLVKTYVKQLFIDLAIVIGDPDKRVVAEPSACLGLWRFDHIDVSLCPGWPDRFEAEAKLLGQPRDVIRASVALGLSSAELETLLAEAE